MDELNSFSYACHYRNLDSAEAYAQRAYNLSEHYGDGRAEALNNLAFVSMARMDYARAGALLGEVAAHTDNQIELLVCDVQQMRLCQRMSRNREFYDYCERARMRLRRIDEERDALPERMSRRMIYAETEFYIVNSVYYYYVGLERQSAEVLLSIDPDGGVQADTAQYLNYLYNMGSGGIIREQTQDETNRREFEILLKCYLTSVKYGYTFFEANAMEAMAEHVVGSGSSEWMMAYNGVEMDFVSPDSIDSGSKLAEWMAGEALRLFSDYGDVYQIAGARRTLASTFMESGDSMAALEQLGMALDNKKIDQAPDLVASIREQLSVAYSAIDDKPSSDYNRNIYLDLQEKTRQDSYLESRAGMLDRTVSQLNMMIAVVVTAILLLVVMLCLFYYLNRRRSRQKSVDILLMPLREWQETSRRQAAERDDRIEEICEDRAQWLMRVRDGERRVLENRAKVSLVSSIIPFIDRILNEVRMLASRDETAERRAERYDYIAELACKIDECNDVLTHWIQLRGGHIDLHIESFPLQQLFDIVARSKTGFVMSGQTLSVVPTDVCVKADKVLTLFMINTLADNARKFTPRGGHVSISAVRTDAYAEISVADTGCGMSAKQLNGIFEHKVYNGHGFGLMNCRGIIERYRKISRIFSVCEISAESEVGQGSRFFFRLPLGKVKAVMVALLFVVASAAGALPSPSSSPTPSLSSSSGGQSNLALAKSFADSAYFSNIDGTYGRTIAFADSCRKYLNRHYLDVCPRGKWLMQRQGDLSLTLPEIAWFHDSVPTNYNIILDMRNESAVAALALHEWQLYAYNNKVYTLLFKEMSADETLPEYCRVMQQSQANKTIAIIVLMIILIMILPAYYILYYRHRLYFRFCEERVRQINDILLTDVGSAEKLHSIEQLAYEQYPAELREVVDKIVAALRDEMSFSKEQEVSMELAEDECRRAEYEDNNMHITNSVLDNCLSALKHETMYYPSRIRQLVTSSDSDIAAIKELAEYYRDIYSILSRQAVRQTERVKIRLEAVPVDDIVPAAGSRLCVLGNRNLLEYLFEILKRQNNRQPIDVEVEAKDNQYLVFTVRMTELNAADCHCAVNLFVPSVDTIPYLLCRQIVRDHSEATNRRGCGILAEKCGRAVVVRITLPRHFRPV